MSSFRSKRVLFPLLFVLVPILVLVGFRLYATGKDLKTIADPAASIDSANSAAKHLRAYKGQASFWLNIANDPGYDLERRRFCVRQFLAHFVRAGQPFQEFLKTVGVPVDWISPEQIFSADKISGWLPVDRPKGGSVFIVRILPGDTDKYWVDVFIQFPERLDVEDVRKAFAGNKVPDPVATCVVTACVAWDSVDLEDQFGKPSANSQ